MCIRDRIRTEEGDFECMRTCHPDFIGFNCYGNDTTEYLPYFEIDYEAMLHADNREVSYLMKLMDKPGIGRACLLYTSFSGSSHDRYHSL